MKGGILMLVSNVNVYGLDESVMASGYPMQTKPTIARQVTEKDMSRAINLANAVPGSGHDNFLKGIIVQFDLTFSLKAWTEAQRYHWFDFVSSCSTMHKICYMDIQKSCNKYVWPETIERLELMTKQYNALEDKSTEEAKELYLEILYNIPTGFQLTARMTTNYQQLKTIYNQRKNHRLPDWREFCQWIETLPANCLIIGGR